MKQLIIIRDLYYYFYSIYSLMYISIYKYNNNSLIIIISFSKRKNHQNLQN